MPSLSARPRTATGRHAAALRRRGSLPGVLYGHRQDSVPVELDYRATERAWSSAGRTTLVDLELEGQGPRKVLFREVQVNPRSGRLVHADLFAPNLRHRIAADIPVVLSGEAPAVTLRLGVLLQVANTVKVEALPADLPHQLVADVSGLEEVDAVVTAGELSIPTGVTLLSDAGEIVAKVASLRIREVEAEEAEEAAEAEAAAAEAAEEAPGAGSGEPAS